jgi:nicotinamidase-related amidase
MSKKAIIVVDIQNDYFPAGKFPLKDVEKAADNAARVIAHARKHGDLVVHIRHDSLEADAAFFVQDTHGVQIHDKVANLPDETLIIKHFMNPYRETGLKFFLDEKGVTDVVVVGNMSHMCIDAVTRASDDFGFVTTVVHDACATRDLSFEGVDVPAKMVHAAFMAALQFGYAKVVTTDAYVVAA